MDASGLDGQGKPVVFNGNLYHFNPVVHAETRQIAHANAVDVSERVRNLRHTGPPNFRIVRP
jgi:hypothetical protein